MSTPTPCRDRNVSMSGEVIFNILLRCHEIDRRLADSSNLAVNEVHCLGVILLAKPACVKILSDLLGVSSTRTSKILLALERNGYLARLHDSVDHRKEQVVLTEAGRDVAGRILSMCRLYGTSFPLRETIDAGLACSKWDVSGGRDEDEIVSEDC